MDGRTDGLGWMNEYRIDYAPGQANAMHQVRDIFTFLAKIWKGQDTVSYISVP